jgi:serine O-acetyltransferase
MPGMPRSTEGAPRPPSATGPRRILRSLFAVNWHAVRLYRLADRLHRRGHDTAAFVCSAINRMLTGVEIEPGAQFGPGLVIHHGHGIVVNQNVRAGSGCQLYQQVTLGVDWRGSTAGPVLGNRVAVLAGAKIIGGITIGDDAIVGANAVVLADVPAGRVAVGVPARIVPNRQLA